MKVRALARPVPSLLLRPSALIARARLPKLHEEDYRPSLRRLRCEPNLLHRRICGCRSKQSTKHGALAKSKNRMVQAEVRAAPVQLLTHSYQSKRKSRHSSKVQKHCNCLIQRAVEDLKWVLTSCPSYARTRAAIASAVASSLPSATAARAWSTAARRSSSRNPPRPKRAWRHQLK